MSYIVVKKSERDKNGKTKETESLFIFLLKIFTEHGHVLSNLSSIVNIISMFDSVAPMVNMLVFLFQKINTART